MQFIFSLLPTIIIITLGYVPIICAEDDNFSFYASFDNGVNADRAVGADDAKTCSPPQFETGIRGKAVVIGIAVKGENKIPLGISYKAADNLSEETGTLSFWMKPLDWSGEDEPFQVFFESFGKNSVLRIYKYMTVPQNTYSGEILFSFGPLRYIDDAFQWTILHLPKAHLRAWNQDEWHHLAASWSSKNMRLYVDGELIENGELKTPPESPFDEFHLGVFRPGAWDPPPGRTLIDELKIYSVVLKPIEISKEYNRLKTPIIIP